MRFSSQILPFLCSTVVVFLHHTCKNISPEVSPFLKTLGKCSLPWQKLNNLPPVSIKLCVKFKSLRKLWQSRRANKQTLINSSSSLFLLSTIELAASSSFLCISWYMFDVFVSIFSYNRCRRWRRWRLSTLLSVWMTEIISGPLLWGGLQRFNIRLDNKRWFQRVSNTHKCHCDRMLWMLLVEIYCIQYLHSGSRNKSGIVEEWRWCP